MNSNHLQEDSMDHYLTELKMFFFSFLVFLVSSICKCAICSNRKTKTTTEKTYNS